jgi:DNA-binding transcriptional LysR family regulator
MARDLDIDLLRSFMAVAASRNFTRAATEVGRTQSAVSLQIRRLEEITGEALFERSPKSVTITPAGETLILYANRILMANDEVLAHLRQPSTAGLVRLGTPDDYASRLLPPVLAAFTRSNPLTRFEVACDNTVDLVSLLDRGELDLVVGTHPLSGLSGESVRRETLHWVGAPSFVNDPAEPLPLVLFPQGCACRAEALAALGKIDRAWHVAYSTRSLALIESAVRSGAGVSVMEASTVPSDLRVLDGQPGLPVLPDVMITLHRRPAVSQAATRAAEFILGALRQPV